MKRATKALGLAQEPIENAKQHKIDKTTTEDEEKNANKFIALATTPTSSQSQNTRDKLSQLSGNPSHRQKMIWLRQHRRTGLWAQCDSCDRWRYLPHVLDRSELPLKWYCHLNPDKDMADCKVPVQPLRVRDEEDLIHSAFSAGSVVWAKMAGWPAWPAMVDDCPDTEQFYWLDGFSDIPTHYHVAFFDTAPVSRAWISEKNILPYNDNKKKIEKLSISATIRNRILKSMTDADDCSLLPVGDRLEKYGFLARYHGSINTPRPIKKYIICRYNLKLQKAFKLNSKMFEEDSSEDIADDVAPEGSKTIADTFTATTETYDKSNVAVGLSSVVGSQSQINEPRSESEKSVDFDFY